MLFVCPIPLISVVTGADEALVELTAGTNHELKIVDLGLFFYGTDTVQSPIQIQAGRLSAGGTGTIDTPVKLRAGPAADFTLKNVMTANGTWATDNPGYPWGVHPQTGLMMPFFKPFILNSAEIFSVRMIDPGYTISVSGYVVVEE